MMSYIVTTLAKFGFYTQLVHPCIWLQVTGAKFAQHKVCFCWRLLGLIPGGAPFSQPNQGVRDTVENDGCPEKKMA